MFGYQGLQEEFSKHHSPNLDGQHGSELTQPERRHSLQTTLPLILAITIWLWCTEGNITHLAEHLPG